MERGAQRDLEILSTIAQGGPLTQRSLAQKLDIALGLTNLYLKRLARKGYIKLSTVPPNRIKYYLTPKGFTEKARLTYQYLEYSLQLYRQTRVTLREALEPLARQGHRRVVIHGTGEAAELAYLTIRELGLELMGIVDGDSPGETFLGLPVRPLAELRPEEVDLIIVATFEPPDVQMAELEAVGLSREKILLLRPPTGAKKL
jgi:DNA-binding MarR family transcriptional regulator